MLKIRVIPVLTFNGFALVKTRQFSSPRMVGNPVQAARVYNARGVDELLLIDIMASLQNRKINLKITADVIKECYMPIGIGGGIDSIEDINNLLKIGADKIVLKKVALLNPAFIKKSSDYFGSQCISISVDITSSAGRYLIHNPYGENIDAEQFITVIQNLGAGEIILNSVNRDGMMNGFDIEMIQFVEKISSVPIVCVGGGGALHHYEDLFLKTNCEAVGSSSIYHFTQYTPLDIKYRLRKINKQVRL
jgi:cyclase